MYYNVLNISKFLEYKDYYIIIIVMKLHNLKATDKILGKDLPVTTSLFYFFFIIGKYISTFPSEIIDNKNKIIPVK